VLHVPFEIRKALLGFKNCDITTHCSAPELEELIEVVNRVCGEKFGKAPTLMVLKQRAASSPLYNCLILFETFGTPGEIRTPDCLARSVIP